VKLEKRYVRKDGAAAWVHLTTTLLRGADGCARLQLGVINDIAAQKSAQAEVQKLQNNLQHMVEERTAELAEKSAQLEGFVYTIAHDLRAPLRAINGYAEFLAEDTTTTLSSGGVAYLDRIKKAARRMDQLIRDLLSYTRVTQIELRIENVMLRECIDWVLANMREEIEARNATVTVESPMPHVVGERGLLDQVIGHLLNNALKFVPPGERPEVQVRAEARGDYVRVSITDNGIGIRPEFHDRVFRIFERLEDARSYPGTGIGLPIVHKTIERLGGNVGLRSEPGKGSTFWFELRKVVS
jgi:signal transduction histidine kinase